MSLKGLSLIQSLPRLPWVRGPSPSVFRPAVVPEPRLKTEFPENAPLQPAPSAEPPAGPPAEPVEDSSVAAEAPAVSQPASVSLSPWEIPVKLEMIEDGVVDAPTGAVVSDGGDRLDPSALASTDPESHAQERYPVLELAWNANMFCHDPQYPQSSAESFHERALEATPASQPPQVP